MSVCIPVRNEEKNLPDCLKSLGDYFDEVVIVDSGSTDRTRAIAKNFGAIVLDFQWDGQFPKKRNWALQNYDFKHPWILFLDADERLTSPFVSAIEAELPNSCHAGYWVAFTNWFMGKPLRYGDVFTKLCLFRHDAGQYEQFPEDSWSQLDMEVHEHPVLKGTTGRLATRLEHHDYQGLTKYISRHNEYSTWEAKRFLQLSSAKTSEWLRLNRRQRFKYRNLDRWWLAWMYFFISYVAKCGFLDGFAGWYFAKMKFRYFQDIRLKIHEFQAAASQEHC